MLDSFLAVRDGEESFHEFLDHLSGEESARSCQILRGEADEDDRFVDIKNGITAFGYAVSEGWKLCGRS